MKVSCAQAWFFLLFLVENDRNQVSALCSAPTVLCCAGKNDSCRQGCFCDEYCVTVGDCCADYRQTCQLPPSSSPSPLLPTSVSSTSPPSSSSFTSLSFSPSIQSTSPTTNQSPTSLSSSPTSPPSSSSSTSPTTNHLPRSLSSSPTSPPSTSAFSSSTPQQKGNIRAVFHIRVRSTANEEAMRKSVQAFILHLSLMRRQRCEDCSTRVLNISKKYH
ncbi:mucin-2-like [Pimephales promelas]|uniref:mucin-2-like n=1 Tax=Pimephales promelas TaxID=90988 RepID=UPI001955DBE3|nr:mucin-2-like [Pimephales promelas]